MKSANDECGMTNVELPTGWTPVSSSDVCLSITDGDHQAPPQVPIGVPFITISAIGDGKLNLEKATRQVSEDYFDQLKLDRKPRTGDILFSVTGSIGRVAPVAGDCRFVFQRHIAILRPDETKSLSSYLKYALQTPDIQKQANAVSTGTAQLTLPLNGLRNLILPLAPLAEQKRIADKLEAVLGRVDACRARLDRVPALLKRFRQSVLAAATSGKLTEEWRVTNGVSDGWESVTLGSLMDSKPRNGYSPKSVDFETPVRSLTLTATTSGKFRGEHSKFINEKIPPSSHLWLVPGDILIQRANTIEYVGVSAIFDDSLGKFIYPDLMMKCRANSRTTTGFLHLLLQSEPVRTYFRDNATGTAGNMPKINQGTVISAPTTLPTLPEQQEIVRRVEALFAFADRIEARLATAQKTVERLTPATLAKAFRGELVPQDPSDEPASALLERLHQNTATAPTKPARGKRTKIS